MECSAHNCESSGSDVYKRQLFSQELRFLEKNCDQPKLRFCSASMLAHREMTLAGVGQAVGLAPYIRASDPHLVKILPEEAFFQHTFWLAGG